MFQEKREEYKKMIVPPELKDKILTSLKEKQENDLLHNKDKKFNLWSSLKDVFFLLSFQRKGIAVCSVCLLLMVGLFVPKMIGGRNQQLEAVCYLDGVSLSDTPVEIKDTYFEMASAYQRGTPVIRIPLKIETKEEAELSVSFGKLEVTKNEIVEEIQSGEIFKLKENQDIFWCLGTNEAEGAILTVVQNETTQCYIVQYNIEKDCFMLCKK